MLESLRIRNFTAFEQANLVFSPGLNVIVGTNGTGKSHLLKLGYAILRVNNRLGREAANKPPYLGGPVAQIASVTANTLPSKGEWQKALADDLRETFRPDSLGRLTRRAQGRARTEIYASLAVNNQVATIDFSFSTNSKSEVVLEGDIPVAYVPSAPVFIPTKELLSIFPGLRELYDKFHLALDVTYPDLCDRLSVPLLRGPRTEMVTRQLAALEVLLGGDVRNENGRFYLRQREGGRLEIDLVAEGIRKLATIAFLLNNGSLNEQTTLFWDEPDANLNPALLKELARLLVQLAEHGFQVLIATHSLFLLKEFHILSQQQQAKPRYFGLSAQADGATQVATADDLTLLPDIAALDAELAQSDDFMTVLNTASNED